MNTTEIRTVFRDLAFELTENGTSGSEPALAILAEAVRHLAPGTADALGDSDTSEVMRLRAFAAAHRLVNHALRPAERTAVAARLVSPATHDLAA